NVIEVLVGKGERVFADDAIDHPNRFAVTQQRGCAAHAHFWIGAYRSVWDGDAYAGYHSLQRKVYAGNAGYEHIGPFSFGGRPYRFPGAQVLVTGDDHFFLGLLEGFEQYGYLAAVAYRYGLGFEADKGNAEPGIGRKQQEDLSLIVGHAGFCI